jgi:hypothetical protein
MVIVCKNNKGQGDSKGNCDLNYILFIHFYYCFDFLIIDGYV